jgi:hypothetical protein
MREEGEAEEMVAELTAYFLLWRDLRFSGSSLEMFFDRGIMVLRPTHGDEKRLLFSNYSPWKHRSTLCHLDRSAAQWRDLPSPFPLVIPTGAQRSGGTCGSVALPWKCFSTEESRSFGPPEVMKNGSCSAATLPGSTALPFVISTEAYPDFLLRAAGNDHVCGFP